MTIREEKAIELVESLQDESVDYAISELQRKIENLRRVKETSSYGPEMSDIENALKVLYRAIENY